MSVVRKIVMFRFGCRNVLFLFKIDDDQFISGLRLSFFEYVSYISKIALFTLLKECNMCMVYEDIKRKSSADITSTELTFYNYFIIAR